MTKSPKKQEEKAPEDAVSVEPTKHEDDEQTEALVPGVESTEQKQVQHPELTRKETGMRLFVHAPKYSITFRRLAKTQSQVLGAKGTIKLPDGQNIKIGQTVETVMSPDLKAMLAQGVLIAGRARP